MTDSERYIMLRRRHAKLLTALEKADIGVKADDDDNFTLYPPSTRFPGWISMQELEPAAEEIVVLRTHGGRVFEGCRVVDGGTWDYTDSERRAYCLNDFSHWMYRP